MDAKGHLNVCLSFIFLTTGEINYLFTCLLVIQVYSINCLFTFFAHVSYWCVGILYTIVIFAVCYANTLVCALLFYSVSGIVWRTVCLRYLSLLSLYGLCSWILYSNYFYHSKTIKILFFYFLPNFYNIEFFTFSFFIYLNTQLPQDGYL